MKEFAEAYIETFRVILPTGQEVVYFVTRRGNLAGGSYMAADRAALTAAEEHLEWAAREWAKLRRVL